MLGLRHQEGAHAVAGHERHDDSKKSRRPSAGDSSSISGSRRLDAVLSDGNVSVRRRAIWLRIRRTSGLVREMSEGGTTR
jgi:hypothetical protein